MILFRPNDNASRHMIMRRARSIGADLDTFEIEHVDISEKMVGRVMETEYEWRQQ